MPFCGNKGIEMVEKIKCWDWKLIAYLAGLVFAVGAFVTITKANCERLDKTEQRSLENEKKLIRMDERLIYIQAGIDDIKKEVKSRP